MNLKKRLIISNVAVVIVPMIITIIVSSVFILIQNNIYNTDLSYQNIQKISESREHLFAAHEIIIKDKVNILDNKNYKKISKKFKILKVNLIITKGQESIFCSKKLNKINIQKLICNETLIDNVEYLIDQIPIEYKDGESGNIILFTPSGRKSVLFIRIMFFVITVFIISFIIVNIFISFILSKNILKPVEKLKNALGEISQGNLECGVIEDGDIEIKDLCKSFEMMRLTLKESANTQEKYDENRRMLVSSISHDLRTPITSIKGYVEGIKDGIADTEEKVGQYLDTIYSKASQVDLLIDDLLLYSKLDVKKIKFDFEKTDITVYLNDCIMECEYDLMKAGISLSLNNELCNTTNVIIDRARMQRVIMNIINNSKKYMNNENGKIVITIRQVSDNVVIEIKDNGPGIDEKDLPYVFDRFYRADASRNSASGSGLGLAISKQIVEGNGGHIWALSEKGEGTSIMISLKRSEFDIYGEKNFNN